MILFLSSAWTAFTLQKAHNFLGCFSYQSVARTPAPKCQYKFAFHTKILQRRL